MNEKLYSPHSSRRRKPDWKHPGQRLWGVCEQCLGCGRTCCSWQAAVLLTLIVGAMVTVMAVNSWDLHRLSRWQSGSTGSGQDAISGTTGAAWWSSATAGTLTPRDGAPARPALPDEFDWQAYLKWNPELQNDGITTAEAAVEHYLTEGYLHSLVYKDYDLTLRYTACGGLMNQHYSHVASLTLAHLAHANRVIWPPMQERASFNNRYHTQADKNEQSWVYLDATSLWDLPTIQQEMQERYGIEVVKHPPDVPLPDMTKLETAYQQYNLTDIPHESQLRFRKPIYLARHNPYMLGRAIMDAGRQVLLKHGHQPSTVLVDLPCTLFMIDNRNITVVEDIARILTFSPFITGLANKVVDGIQSHSALSDFNGVHLRMEKDAADWAIIMGGRDKYWNLYKATMVQAGLSPERPLYVASGLLKASKEDEWSRNEMSRLQADIVASKLASTVIYKEMYLSEAELALVSNEQSGLIDLLVMRKARKLVGIGVSTFSFYLYELRLMDGLPATDTELLMLSYIGTDELFFSCGITAISTRARLQAEGRLPDLCRRPSGQHCYSDPL